MTIIYFPESVHWTTLHFTLAQRSLAVVKAKRVWMTNESGASELQTKVWVVAI